MKVITFAVSLVIGVHLACGRASAELTLTQACRVVRQGKQVELHSPYFVFRLNTTSGLRAESWENRLTGRKISLGNGPELEVDTGLPNGPTQAPQWHVSRPMVESETPAGKKEVVFQLTAGQAALSALVTYRWDAKQPVLRKFVEIENTGHRAMNRLLNVRLGSYPTDAKAAGGQRGSPLYLDDEFFLSLAHPAGWATQENGTISLRHYPGIKLDPGKQYVCMETIYGVGKAGMARESFLTHLRSRMRRVVRGHDKPYAIFSAFGGRPGGSFNETEQFVLDTISKVAQGQQATGSRFDLFSVDFWVDYHGDLKQFDPVRFPNGLTKIKRELDKLGTSPGLWIDSSCEGWSIGGNPRVQSCLNFDPQRPETLKDVPWKRRAFCRATEPIRSMYTDAFRYHIRENGVRLLKFDNFATRCVNPNHDHLPGIYSTEPIMNAAIEFFRALDKECPDVFLMLYWGYRSPWWLLHGDTLFDSGIGIEAAHPSDFPAPYARQSVIQKLDQAQWVASDVPPLGKDSLGVWLSDWGWNSSIGKERWQDAFVIDICRGSMLAQPWTDTEWLSPPERKQMADFIALLKARPECFGNPRFILGDPNNEEPYGYCCRGNGRAFFVLNNCCWRDSQLSLKLDSTWGLPDGQAWDLYRWYPEPARLRGETDRFGKEVAIRLRPFEVVLLEVVPSGQPPSLGRSFEIKPIPTAFAEASRPVDVTVEDVRNEPEPESSSVWTVLDPDRFVSSGGASLTKLKDGSILASGNNPSPDTDTITASTDLIGITAIRLEVLPHSSLPSGGPGRAVNGNFALTEFRLTAAPQGSQATAAPVALRNPAADFFQHSYGGWPVAAAIDDDPRTGWSIDPQEGVRHVAVFESQKPAGFAGGTALTFTLKQGDRGHSIGRLRLSVTTAKPPIPLPKGHGPRRLIVRGQVPTSSRGGMLMICVAMNNEGGSPMAVRNVGKRFSAQGKLAGRTIVCQPVLAEATYPAPWQAWRVVVGPSTKPQPFEVAVTTTLESTQLEWRGYYVPE